MIASGALPVAVQAGVHTILGVCTALCAAVLAWTVRSRAAVSSLVFALAGGFRVLSNPADGLTQAAHAVLAQGLLAAACLAAMETSAGWSQRSPLADGGFPTMRQLAWITPAVTLIQIVLGAAHKHQLVGVIPHVSWAFATAICVMMAGAFVLTQQDSGRLLRRISLWLTALTGMQLILGIGAYLVRIGSAPGWLGLAPMTHIATGSLVMSLSTVWAAVVLRDTHAAAEALPIKSGQHS